MTHELKTPVATIALATEMLKKDKVREDENKVANYNNIISDENKRLGTHIERVLQIAQLDRDEFKLKSETVNLHDLLFELLDKFQLRLEDVNADVETNFLAVKDQVKGDSTHLSNVFSNLLDNAIKYKSESDLKILINTQSTNNKLIIRINDNGIGMGKMDQKKIFTKFYRVPSGNIHNVKGFGLGLSYVKTIIESHKGHIEVDSELNKFTTFTVSLPITNKISL
jgi:two-component system phosphate regulon sensor histidine kinase PhoR